MTDKRIFQLASQFRKAIDIAFDKGCFEQRKPFCDFPYACCGLTSYLLARYLIEHNVQTLWISNDREGWTHAWLVVNDQRVSIPRNRVTDMSEIADVLKSYGMKGSKVVNNNYSYKDIEKGLIIDITGDQFDDYDIPVYVGYMDDFHASFDYLGATDLSKEGYPCDEDIYSIISDFL